MPTPERPFTVGHDLLFLHPRMAGVRVYSTNLLTALLSDPVAAAFRHVIYVSRDGAGCLGALPPNADVRVMPVTGARKLAKLWWQQAGLPLLAARDGIDVLQCYDYVVPLLTRVPTVMTVHDVRYLDRASPMGLRARLARAALLPLCIRSASAVAVVSQLTLDAIVQRFPIGGRPTAIVPDAPEPLNREGDEPGILGQLGIRPPYVLAVGTVSPHKNYAALIDAFATLSRPELMLVIAGRESPHSSELMARATSRGVSGRVVLTGFTARRTLAALYRRATAFVLPSQFEGFGIPVLEAMQFGVPVACSTAGAVPEVAGDAARYFDPRNTAEMVAAIRDVLDDQALRASLVANGARRLEHFTWPRSAERLRELLLSLAPQARTRVNKSS